MPEWQGNRSVLLGSYRTIDSSHTITATTTAPAAKAPTATQTIVRCPSKAVSRRSTSPSRVSTVSRACLASPNAPESFSTRVSAVFVPETLAESIVDDSGGGGRAVVAALGFSRSLVMMSSGGMSFARSWATAFSVSTSPGVSRRSCRSPGFAPGLRNSPYTRHQLRNVLGGTPIWRAARAGGRVSVGIRHTGCKGSGYGYR